MVRDNNKSLARRGNVLLAVDMDGYAKKLECDFREEETADVGDAFFVAFDIPHVDDIGDADNGHTDEDDDIIEGSKYSAHSHLKNTKKRGLRTPFF